MLKKSISRLLLAVISSVAIGAYAADAPAPANDKKDETTVVGACMTVSIQKAVPGITDDKISTCTDGDVKILPKCLGIASADFTAMVQACNAQLVNAKCVASKLKVPLIQYADCGYEKDPEGCYKTLGTSSDAIVKLSQECDTTLSSR